METDNTIKLGNLLSVAEQVQAFAQSRKTGEIVLTNKPQPARISLVDGEVIDAEFEALTGLDAAIALINVEDASTEFIVGRQPVRRTIRMPYVQVLCEAARTADESANGGGAQGSNGAAPELKLAEAKPVVPTLKILLANQEVRTHALKPGIVYIGRTSNNDIPIPDGTISQHHASIEVVKERVVLRDLGSRNGTYVSGVKISEEVLRDVEDLQFGSVQAFFSMGRHDLFV